MTNTAAVSDRRTELLDAAIHEFIENGFAAVGVREITGRARVSHGTFYNYFESKRQLLSALIEQEFAVLLSMIPDSKDVSGGSLTESGLRNLVESVSAAVLTLVSDRIEIYTFLLTEGPGVDDSALNEFIDLYYEAARRAGLILQGARDVGVVTSSIDADFVSQAWISFLVGVIAGMVTGTDNTEPATAATVLANILLDGLAPT